MLDPSPISHTAQSSPLFAPGSALSHTTNQGDSEPSRPVEAAAVLPKVRGKGLLQWKLGLHYSSSVVWHGMTVTVSVHFNFLISCPNVFWRDCSF